MTPMNGWQSRLLAAALTLGVLGILGGVGVYANQGRIEERVSNVEDDADACCTEAGEATKALIRLETRFDGLEKSQKKILDKLDKLVEKR